MATQSQTYEETPYKDTARAKINLTLHVGPRDSDGYHPLHSLVVFADFGDELTAVPDDNFSLKSKGPFASDLPGPDENLLMTSVQTISEHNDVPVRLAYQLTKNLPVASGIGGGSADAAAALRLLAKANVVSWDEHAEQFLPFGADVPVCYLSRTAVIEGIGEQIQPWPGLGQIPAVLVNPGMAVSTAEVFGLFDHVGTSSEFALPYGSLAEMAKAGRNDLQPIAIHLVPEIRDVLKALEAQKGCELSRMSGSGASCFGLFSSLRTAKVAQKSIAARHPDWWCKACLLGDAS
ncbi:MAG TPA: 4-(cytidine 5'-diphospho)-2-C-methyl-D-erythritol kinase [Hellea balneolensis]|uniref:4-diphosphocytidyl-2-C-methyl-D-erythritol kinase n=1 Tax=Hellea balneolensis TaxID=287478 RepID=A0A7V5U0V8_9PROT|nr:4-(cytidine 5'-diphospho)-2-C-methyl-D-erythritol kinase [Hellea balneolensis]